MGFSRQKYCSGLPYPPPGDLPTPGTEPASLMSPASAYRSFTTGTTWKALSFHITCLFTSLVAQTAQHLPAMRETWVRSLGQEDALEKEMETHSGTLAGKIPWTEEPGGLQSMGSLRVGHDRATSHSLFTFMRWRRKWQPTPVFLPGESQGRGSLVGCRLWGCKESDMTEVTEHALTCDMLLLLLLSCFSRV